MQPALTNPFILTLAIDDVSAAFFNRQRQQYFPPKINFLQAHLSLFHYLPLPADELLVQLKPVAAKQAVFTIEATDVISIGKGVAYKLESKEIQALHKEMQQLWKPHLKPQDLQKLWPHITVQNKVVPQQARELLQKLKADFQPFSFQATGLSLWEYLNGPWQFVETVPFSEAANP